MNDGWWVGAMPPPKPGADLQLEQISLRPTAMNDAQVPPRDEILKAKLLAIAHELPTPPNWRAALAKLTATSTNEDRLAVYQAIRDSGKLPADAGFFLVGGLIDDLVSELPQPRLKVFESQMQAIMEAHGLDEDEFWEKGDEPAEYAEVHHRYMEVWDQLYLDELLARGEHEIAKAFRDDRREHDLRIEAGRKFLFGALTEDDDAVFRWSECLINEVAACIEADSPMGPLGYRYVVEGDFVTVKVYPTPVELVGGPDDGGCVDSDFHLDLGELAKAFDSVGHFSWNALGLTNEDGPQVSIEGTFRGQAVFLQLLARAPDDEEPGLKLNATRLPRLDE